MAAMKETIRDLMFSRNQWEEFRQGFSELRNAFEHSRAIHQVEQNSNKAAFQTANRKIEELKDNLEVLTLRVHEEQLHLRDYKLAQAESFEMVRADLEHHLLRQQEKNDVTDQRVYTCQASVDKMRGELRAVSKEFARINETLKDLQSEISHLEASKVDEVAHKKQINAFEQEQNRCVKRLDRDEAESRQFGNFFLRYLPVMIQTAISENLNQCLSTDLLAQHIEYQNDKIKYFKKTCVERFKILDYVGYLQQTLLQTLEAVHSTSRNKV